MTGIPDGIHTVVVTPFAADGSVDHSLLRSHLEWLIESGVHAIIPGGTTGEYNVQTTEERASVLETAAETVAGRLPILAGTNSARPDETLELSRRAKELGYSGLLLAAPFYSLPSESDLVEHFRRIGGEIGLPIMLYNFPARTGVDMDASFLERALEIEQVAAIKESSGSIGKLHQLVHDFAGRIMPVCGADDQALEYFLWGVRAWVAGASNFMPRVHVALYEQCVIKKDFTQGRELMQRLMPMFDLLEQGGKYNQYTKYGVELSGFPVRTVRPPISPLTDDEKVRFREVYDEVDTLG